MSNSITSLLTLGKLLIQIEQILASPEGKLLLAEAKTALAADAKVIVDGAAEFAKVESAVQQK